MRNALLPALCRVTLLLTLTAACTLDASPAEPACSPVPIMTFNIRYGTAADGLDQWTNRRDQVFELLRSHQPTVVGLQEALRFQIDEILKAVPAYASVGVGRDDGKSAGEHSALLYRTDRVTVEQQGNFWFSDTPEIAGSKHWGNQITRMCTWARFSELDSSKKFYVYNLHLDHISQVSRERSADLLLERIQTREHQDPVIVTGDFNAGESNPAVRALLSDPPSEAASERAIRLRDSFRVLHPDATEVGTFNGFKGNRTGEKIDYILITASIQVKEAAIVRDERGGRTPSDHFPVTALLCF